MGLPASPICHIHRGSLSIDRGINAACNHISKTRVAIFQKVWNRVMKANTDCKDSVIYSEFVCKKRFLMSY